MITLPTIQSAAFDMARTLHRLSEYKLSSSALHCLCVISAAGADALTMTTSTAKAMSLSTAAVTGIADRLEDCGFITRRTARVDRRVIWLEITERGKDALTDILTAA